MSNSKLHTRSSARLPVPAQPNRRLHAAIESPEDALAQAWITALSRMDPDGGAHGLRAYGAQENAEDWIIETLLKLGFAAPDKAYEVAVRIVALSDDPWIIKMVGVSVFADLLRRHGPRFASRLAHDVAAVPRLCRALVHASPMAQAI